MFEVSHCVWIMQLLLMPFDKKKFCFWKQKSVISIYCQLFFLFFIFMYIFLPLGILYVIVRNSSELTSTLIFQSRKVRLKFRKTFCRPSSFPHPVFAKQWAFSWAQSSGFGKFFLFSKMHSQKVVQKKSKTRMALCSYFCPWICIFDS